MRSAPLIPEAQAGKTGREGRCRLLRLPTGGGTGFHRSSFRAGGARLLAASRGTTGAGGAAGGRLLMGGRWDAEGLHARALQLRELLEENEEGTATKRGF